MGGVLRDCESSFEQAMIIVVVVDLAVEGENEEEDDIPGVEALLS